MTPHHGQTRKFDSLLMTARTILLLGAVWLIYGLSYLSFCSAQPPARIASMSAVLYILCGCLACFTWASPTSRLVAKSSLSLVFLVVTFASLFQLYRASSLGTASGEMYVLASFVSCLLAFVSYALVSHECLHGIIAPVEDMISTGNSFFSAQSLASGLRSPLLIPYDRFSDPSPSISYTSSVRSPADISAAELKTIEELRLTVRDVPNVSMLDMHAWFKLAWSRQLDVSDAAAVLHNHLEYIERFDIASISIDTIKQNFRAGFSVLAGRDLSGRPMLWQRMKFMTPSTIPLSVGIKSTWLALDAGLADASSNRLGVCLIYDFKDIGFSNITLNIFDIRDGSLACGLAHPSHISRVVFLDAPRFFRIAFAAVAPLLPKSVTSVIEFTDSVHGIATICRPSELPRYLRESRDLSSDVDDYLQWLFNRLEGQKLLYEPAV